MERGCLHQQFMEQANKDIDLWFYSIDFYKAVRQSKKVVFVLPGGDVYGLLHEEKDEWKLDASYEIKQEPLAFQERCVGEILDAIEANCTGIRATTFTKPARSRST